MAFQQLDRVPQHVRSDLHPDAAFLHRRPKRPRGARPAPAPRTPRHGGESRTRRLPARHARCDPACGAGRGRPGCRAHRGRAAGSSRRGSRAGGSAPRRRAARPPRDDRAWRAAARSERSGLPSSRTIQFSTAPEQAMQPFGMNRPGQGDSRGTGAGRALGWAVASRMSPAPPNFSRRSPSRLIPATKADATWSAQPATTGVPAARPVAPAASPVTSPMTSCERPDGWQQRPVRRGRAAPARDRSGRSRARESPPRAPSCARSRAAPVSRQLM